jgi:hypothetical protein
LKAVASGHQQVADDGVGPLLPGQLDSPLPLTGQQDFPAFEFQDLGHQLPIICVVVNDKHRFHWLMAWHLIPTTYRQAEKIENNFRFAQTNASRLACVRWPECFWWMTN